MSKKSGKPPVECTDSEPPLLLHEKQPLGPTAVALTLLTVALWGGTPVAVSFTVDRLPPVAVAGLRFALAAVFMLFWCRFERTSLRLRPGQLAPPLIAGALLFVQISLFNWGIQASNSSHATLFINTFIFWVAGLEHFVTREHCLTPLKTLGLILAAAGAFLLLNDVGDSPAASSSAAPQDTPTLFGDLLLLGSALILGIKIIYTRHALKLIEPGKLILWHDVVGVVLFAAYSLSFETVSPDAFDTPVVLGLLYQGVIVAGLCFALQAHLLRKHAASQISVFSFATPLFGIALAVLLRGDHLSPWLFVSSVCVAVGILMVNSQRD